MVCEIELSNTPGEALLPDPKITARAQAVKATAHPTETATVSRGPRKRLETAMMTIYSAMYGDWVTSEIQTSHVTKRTSTANCNLAWKKRVSENRCVSEKVIDRP